MTRNVEMEISIWELLLAAKKRWKLIVLIVIACSVLSVAAGIIGGLSIEKSVNPEKIEAYEQEEGWFSENMKMYEESTAASQDARIPLRETWLRLARMQKEHPLMEVDPYNCNYVNIVMHFEDESGYHSGTVFNWLQTAELKQFISDESSDVEKYLNDLILIDDKENETIISVIDVDGFDYSKAAEYLEEYLKSQSDVTGMRINSITAVQSTGYLYKVADFQKYTRDTLNSVHGALVNLINVQNAFPQPQAPEVINTGGIKLNDVVKKLIMGCLLGLLAGTAIAMVLIMKQGRVISQRQMEDTFDLEQLGDCSKGHLAAVDVLNSNLDLMTGEGSEIMLLGSSSDMELDSFVKKWNESGTHTFVAGKNIIDDTESINALQDVCGIVLGICIGESRLEDIQRIVLRANKIQKKILGFVQI